MAAALAFVAGASLLGAEAGELPAAEALAPGSLAAFAQTPASRAARATAARGAAPLLQLPFDRLEVVERVSIAGRPQPIQSVRVNDHVVALHELTTRDDTTPMVAYAALTTAVQHRARQAAGTQGSSAVTATAPAPMVAPEAGTIVALTPESLTDLAIDLETLVAWANHEAIRLHLVVGAPRDGGALGDVETDRQTFARLLGPDILESPRVTVSTYEALQRLGGELDHEIRLLTRGTLKLGLDVVPVWGSMATEALIEAWISGSLPVLPTAPADIRLLRQLRVLAGQV